jgi:cytochrome c oxidase subunit 3
MFMVFYFFMTGLHGFHMLVGIILVTILLIMAMKGRFTDGNDQPVEISGLYWHLIDIIWIFLFPLLYLVSGIKGSGPLW